MGHSWLDKKVPAVMHPKQSKMECVAHYGRPADRPEEFGLAVHAKCPNLPAPIPRCFGLHCAYLQRQRESRI
jgi:hypothetical protein